MTQLSTTVSTLAFTALAAAAPAQSIDMLLSYSQPEQTVSGSGGTVLGTLLPNEIAYLDFAPCPAISAEKWLPRTAANVMAGDENGDGVYFNPSIFGNVDALLANRFGGTTVGSLENQRTAFWSVAAPIGPVVSATPFRPGDVARIVRTGLGDGQVEYFMRQELFNQALGRPPAAPLDVDAIAFQPNYGVFFSIDADVLATTACGPTLVQDGDVLCVPPWALTLTPDMRVAAVLPSSVYVVHPEAQMDWFTANAQVTDNNGVCVASCVDVESLEIDLFGPATTLTTCSGVALPVPTLIYSTETGTGASLLTTQLGGQIYTTACGPAGTSCGFGPTWGPQLGVRPSSTTTGAASYVDALAIARSCVHVLEPQQHVVTVPAAGLPMGALQIDYNNPFPLSLILIELVPPVVPLSLPAFPFSQQCFPDLYALGVFPWVIVPTGFGSFPMPAIPAGFTGKVLFQGVGVGFGTFELSTPCVVDLL